MESNLITCMGCGKDTTARGGVCRQCYTMKDCEPSKWDVVDYEISSSNAYRDEYEQWHERISGMDRD